MRLRIDLGYDGQAFSGWAKQPDRPSVQDSLESALATVLRVERDQVRTVVAGRTDAGVHAVGQVCHVDLPEGLSVRLDDANELARLTKRLRGALGKDNHVWIHEVLAAPEGFDARFSPVARRYEYRIADSQALRDPRHAGHTVWRDEDLGYGLDEFSRSGTAWIARLRSVLSGERGRDNNPRAPGVQLASRRARCPGRASGGRRLLPLDGSFSCWVCGGCRSGAAVHRGCAQIATGGSQDKRVEDNACAWPDACGDLLPRARTPSREGRTDQGA